MGVFVSTITRKFVTNYHEYIKIIYDIFSVLMIGISCQKDQAPIVEISSADISAIDGMEKSYNSALLYNDSILNCMEFDPFCENEFLEYCDDMFHQHVDEYENHHNNFSHGNNGDDNHHEYMNQNNHGNGMMGGQNYWQCDESMEQMDSLLVHHDDYH